MESWLEGLEKTVEMLKKSMLEQDVRLRVMDSNVVEVKKQPEGFDEVHSMLTKWMKKQGINSETTTPESQSVSQGGEGASGKPQGEEKGGDKSEDEKSPKAQEIEENQLKHVKKKVVYGQRNTSKCKA